jgi:hypothetical protein
MRSASAVRQSVATLGVLTAVAVCIPRALACPYLIRDSGYIVQEPRPFYLYVFVDRSAPGSADLSQRVHKAAATELAGSNVELKLVPVQAGKVTDAAPHYQRAGSPKPPAAVLVSARDDVLLLPGFGGASVNERTIRQALRQVASSPARRRITVNLVRPWCVVLLGVGTEVAATESVESLIEESVKSVREGIEKADQGRLSLPSVLHVSLRDPNEKVLLWSLGLLDGDRSAPKVAVLFGRGRRLGPVLKGGQLTQEKLSHLLWLLGQNCTCTSDPTWLLGPVAPLVWPRRQEQQVANTLGFDPNSPMAFSTLSGVWSTLGKPSRQAATPKAEADLGYVEFSGESAAGKSDDDPAVATRKAKIAEAGTPAPKARANAAPGNARKPAPPKSADKALGKAAPEAGTRNRSKQPAKPKQGDAKPAKTAPPVTPAEPGDAGEAQPAEMSPTGAAGARTAERPSAEGESADAQPARTPNAAPKRFESTRASGEPTLGTRATRLLMVFSVVLCLLAIGSGALLVIHRRGQA